MFLDHMRVELRTGRHVLLPPEEWDRVRQARKFGDGFYTTTDIYGLKVSFDPQLIYMVSQITEGGLKKAAKMQERMEEIVEDGEPWR